MIPIINEKQNKTTGHTAIALRFDGKLYICESTASSSYWSVDGIQKTPYQTVCFSMLDKHFTVMILYILWNAVINQYGNMYSSLWFCYCFVCCSGLNKHRKHHTMLSICRCRRIHGAGDLFVLLALNITIFIMIFLLPKDIWIIFMLYCHVLRYICVCVFRRGAMSTWLESKTMSFLTWCLLGSFNATAARKWFLNIAEGLPYGYHNMVAAMLSLISVFVLWAILCYHSVTISTYILFNIHRQILLLLLHKPLVWCPL